MFAVDSNSSYGRQLGQRLGEEAESQEVILNAVLVATESFGIGVRLF
jgi:hypothetical protein